MKLGHAPTIEQLMTREIWSCGPGDSLNQAANLLWDYDCGVLPVIADERVVGMLTDRDICMAAYLQDRPLTDLLVSTAMSNEVHACSLTDTLEDAEMLMRAHLVRRVPVLDSEERLVGVVSLNDLVREVSEHQDTKRTLQLLETLSVIGAPRPVEQEQPEQAE